MQFSAGCLRHREDVTQLGALTEHEEGGGGSVQFGTTFNVSKGEGGGCDSVRDTAGVGMRRGGTNAQCKTPSS